jgi:tetratricopeptide (TPR) repeat protein
VAEPNDPFAAAHAGDLRRACSLFEEIIARGEANAMHWLRYGGVLKDLHRDDEAIAAFQRAARRIARRGKYLKRKWRALARALEGSIHYRRHALDLAVRAFRSSVRIFPTPEAWTQLAVALIGQRGHGSKAPPRCLKRALALDPNYEEAHYNLGVHFRFREKLELAQHHLRRAIEIDPQYSRAYAELGFCLCSERTLDRLTEARQLLLRSIEIDPNDGWSRLYLALVYWRLDDLHNADAQYRAVIAIWPKLAISYAFYGDFLSSIRQFRPGGAQLRRALKIDPRWAGGHFFYAKHLHRRGRIDQARRLLHLARKLGDARAASMLGLWKRRPHGRKG